MAGRAPLFLTHELAARIERHEALSALEHVRAELRLNPDSDAAALETAGGVAAFIGHGSPANRASGIGAAGAVTAAELDAIEQFYAARGLATTFATTPLTDRSLFALLSERGYATGLQLSVHACTLDDVPPASLPDGVEIRRAGLRDLPLVAATFDRRDDGFDWAHFMAVRCFHKPTARLFLAFADGKLAARATLEVIEGAGELQAADTLDEFRGRGIQAALIQARLQAAREEGCDLAIVGCEPGTVSERNILRGGFQLLYTSLRMHGSRRSAP